MMPPQQNMPQQQQPMAPQPGMPQQGPGIFAAPPPGQQQPKHKKPIGLIVALVFFVLATIVFGTLSVMLYGQMTSYRDDYQSRAAVDIEKAEAALTKELEADFAEREKEPTRDYVTPNSAASVKIVYPKTWDLYAQEDNEKGTVDNYFNTNFVPDIGDKTKVYSLRLEVVDKNYPDVVKGFDSAVKKGEVTVKPYVPVNVKNAEKGVRLDGNVRKDVPGAMVILPVRDKTIMVWTESGNYTKDFENIVLKNLTYNP